MDTTLVRLNQIHGADASVDEIPNFLNTNTDNDGNGLNQNHIVLLNSSYTIPQLGEFDGFGEFDEIDEFENIQEDDGTNNNNNNLDEFNYLLVILQNYYDDDDDENDENNNTNTNTNNNNNDNDNNIVPNEFIHNQPD